jgi:hypothetical protein
MNHWPERFDPEIRFSQEDAIGEKNNCQIARDIDPERHAGKAGMTYTIPRKQPAAG